MAFLKPALEGLTAAMAVVSLLAASSALALQVGDRLEQLDLRDFSGEPAVLEPTQTEVLVIDFWASWCRPCREVLPALAAFATETADPRLRIAAIGIDRDRETATRFLDEVLPDRGLALYHDADGSVLARIGVPGMPTTVLVVEGVVRSIEVGFAPEQWAELRERVGAALAAQPATDSPRAPR